MSLINRVHVILVIGASVASFPFNCPTGESSVLNSPKLRLRKSGENVCSVGLGIWSFPGRFWVRV